MVDEARRNLEPISHMAEEAAKCMGPWRRLAEEAGRRMGESWEVWRRMVEAAAPQYQRVVERWAEFERRYQIAEEQAAPILAKYKWFITPSLPMPLVFEVVKEGQKPGRRDKAINRLFVDYFAADNWQALSDMVASWGDMPLLKKRMRVLRDCVKALQAADNGEFNAANVVLPTLMAQIDGVLTDYLDSEGVEWDTLFEDAGKGPRAKMGRKSQFRKHRNTLLRDPLDDVACHVFLDILLQRGRPGRPLGTPFGFSRHKVMHGENVTYGKKAYVVRAFLVLDYLAYSQ